jgi:hypothetical protein
MGLTYILILCYPKLCHFKICSNLHIHEFYLFLDAFFLEVVSLHKKKQFPTTTLKQMQTLLFYRL